MRRFVGYRPNPPQEYYAAGAANAPDQPQYQGVEFDDGTVVCRWLTEYRSHSIWASWSDFYAIHGHPEYGTRIEWLDWPDATPAAPFCRCGHAESEHGYNAGRRCQAAQPDRCSCQGYGAGARS